MIDSLKMGGAEQVVTLLAREAALRKMEVSVISLRSDVDPVLRARLEECGTALFEMPAARPFGPVRIGRLGTFLRSRKFDIVQTHLSTANIVGVLAAHFAGTKVIGTLHTIDSRPDIYHPVKHRLETQTLRYAAHRVVAVGKTVAESQSARLQRAIDIVPNAVLPCAEISYTERCAIRRRLTGDAENPLFISVGRLSTPKGFDVLIDAFSVVIKTNPNAKLLIVGAGVLQQELEQQISNLSLEGSVYLLGRRDDVPRLLASADLYVSASIWEGMPLSILEAMSAGLPVIATSVGDLPGVVSNNTGILVPPGESRALAEAMLTMLRDLPAAARMGKNAKEYVLNHHSASAWMDRLMHLYNQVLNTESIRQAI
jgi:glycosyltransferase involved in cell wall biosynthesis